MDEQVFYAYNSWKTGDFKLPDGTVERDIHRKAVRLLADREILVLLGLRQTGKSTLTLQLIHELLSTKQSTPERIFYFSFDDRELRYELAASFGNFLKIVERFWGSDIKNGQDRIYIFIDEVQKLPGFVEYIKSLYDLRLPIKWILTGSSSLELKTQVKESLAGRSITLQVLPFTEAEIFRGLRLTHPDKRYMNDFILGVHLPDKKGINKYQASIMAHKRHIQKIFDDCLVYGSLPAICLSSDREKKQILLKNYRDTYLEQDIRNLVKEDKLWVYQKVMELLASRIGDLLNYSTIASQLEVTVDTVKRYSMLLEKTFMLRNLTTYSKNVRNEVLKTPKVYFTDLGLRNSILGLTSLAQAEKLGQKGVLLENAVCERLSSIISLSDREARLHYWRTKTKEEVDFVVVTPERVLPIEVKNSKQVQPRQLKGLRRFMEKENEIAGIVIGMFEDAGILSDRETNIYLIPYWML
ncbi:MAG: ATP-binding protein [Nitrospirae bacterium]|nr:ATP-binding protein [Nitrospirota bacterium]